MLTALTAVWDFFTKSWGRYILPLLVVLGLFLFVFFKGADYQKGKDTAELTKVTATLTKTTATLKQTTAVLNQQTDAITRLNNEQKLAKEKSDQVEKDLQKQLTTALNKKPTVVTVIKQVPTYVTSPASDTWSVSAGFVQLYNQSISPDFTTLGAYAPGSTGISADAPSGIVSPVAAGVIVLNNITCLRWRDQLVTWQQWYAAEQVIVNKINSANKVDQANSAQPPQVTPPATKQ